MICNGSCPYCLIMQVLVLLLVGQHCTTTAAAKAAQVGPCRSASARSARLGGKCKFSCRPDKPENHNYQMLSLLASGKWPEVSRFATSARASAGPYHVCGREEAKGMFMYAFQGYLEHAFPKVWATRCRARQCDVRKPGPSITGYLPDHAAPSCHDPPLMHYTICSSRKLCRLSLLLQARLKRATGWPWSRRGTGRAAAHLVPGSKLSGGHRADAHRCAGHAADHGPAPGAASIHGLAVQEPEPGRR